MQFVKLIYYREYYDYIDVSNIEMNNLGNFLSCDVRYNISRWKNWVLNDQYLSASGNITALHKLNGIVSLNDLYPEEDEEPAELEMTIQQFVQLLDDWETKVCTLRPAEIIIIHENGEFTYHHKRISATKLILDTKIVAFFM